MNNEELQSRREFFKKAAKGALPILAAVALANVPDIANAATKESMDCHYKCEAVCAYNCQRNCSGRCDYTCKSLCKGA